MDVVLKGRAAQIRARQARTRARSSLALAAALAIVAIAARFALDWRSAWIFAPAAFFVAVALVEHATGTWHISTPTGAASSLAGPAAVGLEMKEYIHGGERVYGTVVRAGRHAIHLDLRRDVLLREREQFARRLADDAPSLVTEFESFLEREAALRPSQAKEIRGLEIEVITSHGARATDAEVYFTFESGGDIWFARLEDGKFTELWEET